MGFKTPVAPWSDVSGFSGAMKKAGGGSGSLIYRGDTGARRESGRAGALDDMARFDAEMRARGGKPGIYGHPYRMTIETRAAGLSSYKEFVEIYDAEVRDGGTPSIVRYYDWQRRYLEGGSTKMRLYRVISDGRLADDLKAQGFDIPDGATVLRPDKGTLIIDSNVSESQREQERAAFSEWRNAQGAEWRTAHERQRIIHNAKRSGSASFFAWRDRALEIVDRMEGDRRDPLAKAITFEDLQQNGVADVILDTITYYANPVANPLVQIVGQAGDSEPPAQPQAPSGVALQGVVSSVFITWAAPAPEVPIAFTEVFRSATTDFADAVFVGSSEAPAYHDVTNDYAPRYYFLRHVSKQAVPSLVAGPFGPASAGKVDAATDFGPLLITAQQLAAGTWDASAPAFSGQLVRQNLAAGLVQAGTAALDLGVIRRANIGTAVIGNLKVDRLGGEQAPFKVRSAHIGPAVITRGKVKNGTIRDANFKKTGVNSIFFREADFADAAITTAKIEDLSVDEFVVDGSQIHWTDVCGGGVGGILGLDPTFSTRWTGQNGNRLNHTIVQSALGAIAANPPPEQAQSALARVSITIRVVTNIPMLVNADNIVQRVMPVRFCLPIFLEIQGLDPALVNVTQQMRDTLVSQTFGGELVASALSGINRVEVIPFEGTVLRNFFGDPLEGDSYVSLQSKSFSRAYPLASAAGAVLWHTGFSGTTFWPWDVAWDSFNFTYSTFGPAEGLNGPGTDPVEGNVPIQWLEIDFHATTWANVK